MALHLYHQVHDTFPPAYLPDEDGRPMTSWRTLILPHLEQQRLYDKYDETKPWDDPANAMVRETAIEIYRSPRDPQDDSLLTNYLAVTGERAMFPGSEGRQLSDVRDGTSSTIMVVEVLNSDVQWSEPRDLDMNNYRRVAEGADPAATNVIPRRGVVLFADGSVHRLNEKVTREMLRMYFTAAGGERAPPWPSQ